MLYRIRSVFSDNDNWPIGVEMENTIVWESTNMDHQLKQLVGCDLSRSLACFPGARQNCTQQNAEGMNLRTRDKFI